MCSLMLSLISKSVSKFTNSIWTIFLGMLAGYKDPGNKFINSIEKLLSLFISLHIIMCSLMLPLTSKSVSKFTNSISTMFMGMLAGYKDP